MFAYTHDYVLCLQLSIKISISWDSKCIMIFFFLAVLKKHNKSIWFLKSTESKYGSLNSSEFHAVERVEESPAISYSDTFIIWNYFCMQTNYPCNVTVSQCIVYMEDWFALLFLGLYDLLRVDEVLCVHCGP